MNLKITSTKAKRLAKIPKHKKALEALVKLYCENAVYRQLLTFLISQNQNYQDFVILTALEKKIKPLLIGKQADNLLNAFKRIIIAQEFPSDTEHY